MSFKLSIAVMCLTLIITLLFFYDASTILAVIDTSASMTQNLSEQIPQHPISQPIRTRPTITNVSAPRLQLPNFSVSFERLFSELQTLELYELVFLATFVSLLGIALFSLSKPKHPR
jgi:hypothetical protein